MFLKRVHELVLYKIITMVSVLTATLNTKFAALCRHKLDIFCVLYFFTIHMNYYSVKNSVFGLSVWRQTGQLNMNILQSIS
jgi:hypothetical protein